MKRAVMTRQFSLLLVELLPGGYILGLRKQGKGMLVSRQIVEEMQIEGVKRRDL